MATTRQVAGLLDRGHSYETAARELGISAGLAFMIATGVPADGSGAPTEGVEKRLLAGSSQELVHQPQRQPARNERVLEWVRERARRELGGRA